MNTRNPSADSEAPDESVTAVTAAVQATGQTDAQAKENALEEAAVKQWQERIDECKKYYKDIHEEWAKLRKAILLRYDEDDQDKKFIVNIKLILSTLSSLLPHVYAKDPDVSVKPSESVTPERYEVFQKFARTCEIVVAREFKDGMLKHQARRVVRAAMRAGVGWLKVGFQTVTHQDPIILRKIEDATTQLQRIEYLIQEIKDGQGKDEQNAAKEELVNQLNALKAQVDVLVSKGFTFDVVSPKDVFVPPNMAEILDYRWSPWIVHRIWYKGKAAVMEAFNLTEEQVGTATEYASNDEDSATKEKGAVAGTDCWYAAYEIWHKEAGTILTMLDGYCRWIRAPYPPKHTAQRFYSLFMLGFNWVDEEFLPVPDVECWIELQDEYNRTRSAYAEFRRRSIPYRIFNKGIIDESDALRLADPSSNEMVGIKADPSVPIGNLVAVAQTPSVDPRLYDTSAIRNDLETVSGMQDAARGPVFQAKTATEAEIQQSGLVTRITDRSDAIEGWVGEIARYVVEVGIQAFDESDAKRIAGPSAVWPQMTKDEAYHLLDIDIRPGTSGRPNLLREQQAWATLLPVVQQMMLQIAQLRAQGQESVAECLTELLRETFRRADERLDPDKFIPRIATPANTQGAPGNANATPQAAGTGGDAAILGGNGITVEPAGQGPRITPGEANPGNLGS